MWTFEAVVSVLASILSIAVGIGGAPVVVDFLKSQIGAEGKAAIATSVVVALAFGVATALVEGAITEQSFTPERVGTLIMIMWGSSQVQWQRIKRDEQRTRQETLPEAAGENGTKF